MAFSILRRELFLARFNRMPSRKNRSRKNRSRRNRCWSGGMAPVNDTSMNMSQRDSMAQGSQYLSLHKGQYGGAAAYPTAVTDSVLSGSMIAATRTGPLDTAMAQIQGMQDGGKRRRHGRSHRHRRSRRSQKKRGGKRSRRHKHSRRSHRGGSHSGAVGASVSGSSMLLPPGMGSQAALHHEWADAKNPNAFVPKA